VRSQINYINNEKYHKSKDYGASGHELNQIEVCHQHSRGQDFIISSPSFEDRTNSVAVKKKASRAYVLTIELK
jgi:hypothetical protein